MAGEVTEVVTVTLPVPRDPGMLTAQIGISSKPNSTNCNYLLPRWWHWTKKLL